MTNIEPYKRTSLFSWFKKETLWNWRQRWYFI